MTLVQNNTQLTSTVENLAQSQVSTNNSISELASTVNSFMKATNTKTKSLAELLSSSSKDPQGNNGGGSSSAPATPILESTEEESLKESFSPISGASRLSTEQMISKAGFNPFVLPKEYDSEEETQELNNISNYDPFEQNLKSPPWCNVTIFRDRSIRAF